MYVCLFCFVLLFIYLFLAVLCLCCCARAFSFCGKRGLLLLAVRRLIVAVASLVAEHGLQTCGLSSCSSQALEHRLSGCGSRAQLFRGMWDLPGPGLEPVSPALAGGFLTTAPQGKPNGCVQQAPQVILIITQVRETSGTLSLWELEGLERIRDLTIM